MTKIKAKAPAEIKSPNECIREYDRLFDIWYEQVAQLWGWKRPFPFPWPFEHPLTSEIYSSHDAGQTPDQAAEYLEKYYAADLEKYGASRK